MEIQLLDGFREPFSRSLPKISNPRDLSLSCVHREAPAERKMADYHLVAPPLLNDHPLVPVDLQVADFFVAPWHIPTVLGDGSSGHPVLLDGATAEFLGGMIVINSWC